MAEPSGEIDQGGFASRVHRGHIGLQHDAAILVEQAGDMVAGGELLIATVPLGVARARADRRLDHELPTVRERPEEARQGVHRFGVRLHE